LSLTILQIVNWLG